MLHRVATTGVGADFRVRDVRAGATWGARTGVAATAEGREWQRCGDVKAAKLMLIFLELENKVR